MKAKNHARSSEKKNFSIALPIVLIDQLGDIANKEDRSRNRQIEAFLRESVKKWIVEKQSELDNSKRSEFPKISRPENKRHAQ